MFIVSTQNGVKLYGAYKQVSIEDGVLNCDGSMLPLSVIGATYEILPMQQLPEGFVAHKYTYVGGILVKKPEDLTARRLQLWEEIKAYRDARLLEGGFPAGGHWFYSDFIARSQHLTNARLADLVVIAGTDPALSLVNIQGQSIMVKSMDNGIMPISANLAHEIINNATLQEMGTYGAALYHQSAINAASNLDNYNYKTGFPLICGENAGGA